MENHLEVTAIDKSGWFYQAMERKPSYNVFG